MFIPASLTLPPTTLCELWLDACVLYQRTIFPCLQASNLLSYVAKEPHGLQHDVPWSLDISVGMDGDSNWDTHLCPLHNNSSVHLTTMTEVRPCTRITDGTIRLLSTTRLHTFTPYPSSWNSPAKNSVGPVPVCKMGHECFYGLWVWRRRSNRWQCCLPISNPSAAQHLPRYLVRPSNGLKEVARTTMVMKQLVLAYCRHSHLNQPRCEIFIYVE